MNPRTFGRDDPGEREELWLDIQQRKRVMPAVLAVPCPKHGAPPGVSCWDHEPAACRNRIMRAGIGPIDSPLGQAAAALRAAERQKRKNITQRRKRSNRPRRQT